MKKMKWPDVVGLLAALGFVLRKLVYAGAVDEKNLIIGGHPFVIALWVLTAAVMVLIGISVWKQEEPEAFRPDGSASSSAFLGSGMLGVGILLTVVLNPSPMAGLLGLIWKVLGWISPVCLLLAGFDRMRGRKPFFALYAAPCVFFAVHVVVHYQIWCSNPQFTDYAFALLGTVALSFFSYQQAACAADCGKRKSLRFLGLAAVYLCAVELPGSMYPYLYFGGILWALTNLF